MERKGNLVKLTDMSSDFIIDLKYATSDNFTGVQVYQSAECWLDEHTAQILIKAKEIFEKRRLPCESLGCLPTHSCAEKILGNYAKRRLHRPTTGHGENQDISTYPYERNVR